MDCPLISIIIPVYNVERYLNKCLDSIINQTYNNLEIVLVDDGSTDRSGLICDAYAAKDNRVIVIHKENNGVSVARNIGLEHSHGELIGFVDGDDYVDRQMYELLLKRLKSDNSDMACCNYLQVDEEGCEFTKDQQLPLKDECVAPQTAMKRFVQWGCYYVAPWNKLYKRFIFEAVRFPVGKRYEDLAIIHKIVYQCCRISHINKPLYYYVRRKGSFTLEEFNLNELDFGEAFINIYKFAKKRHFVELKDYCVRRLSYKFEEWQPKVREKAEYRKRYNKLKKKSLFLIYEKDAWYVYSIKGKFVAKIRFIFS